MQTERYAAIDIDEIADRPLGEISAVEFLQVLSHPKLSTTQRVILADKKKYELWVEEGPVLKVPIGEIIAKLRGEKKKLELEVPPWMKFIPEDGIRDLEWGGLVEDIGSRVEAHTGRGRAVRTARSPSSSTTDRTRSPRRRAAP
jgi:hypothetical protein